MGVGDFIPDIFWTRYFIAEKGYNVKYNSLHQGNKSFVLLENNGKASSIKSTNHINIRYFFITYRVKNGEVSVVWCPTEDMIGECITKTLRVNMLRKFRD